MKAFLPILYRDERFLVVDKPGGILVHRTRASRDRVFLVQAVRAQVGRLVHPGHRLDRAASGAIAFATDRSHVAALQEALQAPATRKEYVVLCRGETPVSFTSGRALTSERGVRQEARTEFERIGIVRGFSLLRARLRTGRRHQIRRHLAHLGHQIVGDTKYGKGGINRWLRAEFELPRLFLHATRLECGLFRVTAPVAPDLVRFLHRFDGQAAATLRA